MLWNEGQGEGVKDTEGDVLDRVLREGFSEDLAFEHRLARSEVGSPGEMCCKRVRC